MVCPIVDRYWYVSNLSFPVLTLFLASMTDASSAVSIDIIKHGLDL